MKKSWSQKFCNVHRKTQVFRPATFKKETPEQVLSCEFFEIFKNTYFDVSGHDQLMLVFGVGVGRKKYHMKPNLSGQYSVFLEKVYLVLEIPGNLRGIRIYIKFSFAMK